MGLRCRSSGKVRVMMNDVIISLLVAFPLSCTIYLFRILTNEMQDLVLLHMFAVYFNKVAFFKCNFGHILHLPMNVFPLGIYYPVWKGRVGSKFKLFLVKLCIHSFCSFDHKTCVNKAFLSVTFCMVFHLKYNKLVIWVQQTRLF